MFCAIMVGMYGYVSLIILLIIMRIYYTFLVTIRLHYVIIFAYIVQVPLSTGIIISKHAVSNSSGVDLASDLSNQEQFSRILFLFYYYVVIISSQD